MVPLYGYITHIRCRYTSRTVKCRKSTKMTNMGIVVLIGIIYALDVCYIVLTCSSMTPLELQPLLAYHNDRTWLSWTVPCWQSGTCKHIIYALDANHIASSCSPMTPLDLKQPFDLSQRSYVAVPDCHVLYIHHFKVGHDVRGQSWTVRMSVVVRYN